MAVSAQHLALVNFFHQLMPSNFGVLAYGEQFFTLNVIEIKRRRMRVVSAPRTTFVHLYLADQFSTRLLKFLRSHFFTRRVVAAFNLAKRLPRPIRCEQT
jgi:hypothetical protein